MYKMYHAITSELQRAEGNVLFVIIIIIIIIIIIKAICNAQDPLKKAANALSGS